MAQLFEEVRVRLEIQVMSRRSRKRAVRRTDFSARMLVFGAWEDVALTGPEAVPAETPANYPIQEA